MTIMWLMYHTSFQILVQSCSHKRSQGPRKTAQVYQCNKTFHMIYIWSGSVPSEKTKFNLGSSQCVLPFPLKVNHYHINVAFVHTASHILKTYLWNYKNTITVEPECIIYYKKLKQLYSGGMLTTVCLLQQHTWVNKGGESPLPSEEDNCELVEVTDEEVQQVIQSIPKLDTLILVKKMLKNHSFQVCNLGNLQHWHTELWAVWLWQWYWIVCVQCITVWIVCILQCG